MPYSYDLKINFKEDFTNSLKKQLKCFGYNEVNGSYQDICFSYLNLMKRLVKPTPRKILISKEFKYPRKFKKVLDKIKKEIENGEDITKYLSTKILDLNYHDSLLNDWDVHHLHLGDRPHNKNNKFVNRTGPLLFVRFTHDTAYFIKVYSHGSWAKQEIIKIIHNNWPDSIEQFRLKDVISTSTKISDDDYKSIRKANISTLVEVDEGVVYFPIGMGYALSGHSVEAVRLSMRYIRRLDECENFIRENISTILSEYSYLGLNKHNKIYFYPVVRDNNIFAYELYSGIQIYLCRFI